MPAWAFNRIDSTLRMKRGIRVIQMGLNIVKNNIRFTSKGEILHMERVPGHALHREGNRGGMNNLEVKDRRVPIHRDDGPRRRYRE